MGIVGIWARPQDQEGYNYEVPENPLVIQRPTEDPVEPPPPADDYVEYDESQAGESLPDSQDGGHEGGGHHGHGDDPLDWLRASVPGKNLIILCPYSYIKKYGIILGDILR